MIISYLQQLVSIKIKSLKPVVAISTDFGKTWEYQNIVKNGTKVYNLLKVGNKLLATTLFSDKDISTSELINDRFEINKELNRDFFFPNTNFKKNKKAYIRKKINIKNDTLLYIGQYSGTSHSPKTLGLYKIKNKNNILKSEKIIINDNRVLDFIKFNQKLFVLSDSYKNRFYSIQVHSSNLNDLNNWNEVVSFNSLNIIRSFELTKNYLYFGIGIELDSQNNYYYNSLKDDTGNILKIKRK